MMSKTPLAFFAFFFLPVVCAELSRSEEGKLYATISRITDSSFRNNSRLSGKIHKESLGIAERQAGEETKNDLMSKSVREKVTTITERFK